ncbi:hypothetical protein GCM10022393_17750 [Aquimarina addita]|uniref:DUF6268 domain-containing protein n=1 Tax=Aquimarina addita TaxID=870485 RepID=A0ABP6UK03_9FLAO
MKNKYLFYCLSLIVQFSISQEYIDLVKLSYGNVYNVGFENSEEKTNVGSLNVGVTYPIKVSDKIAIITGLDYGQQKLDLFPGGTTIGLQYARFKGGINVKHSERWSGSYLLLPKIASQDLHTDGDHFFMGGLVLLKYQKNINFQYRMGWYLSQEGFGILTTPILGLYYLSENKNWEITANLPVNGDVNYRFNEVFSLGIGFEAPVRSYSLQQENTLPNLYVQSSIIEIGPYIQHSFLNKSILVKLQGGYTSISNEVFEEGDTLPIRLSAFEFDDDRTLINPEMNGNLFAKIGLTYRFYIKNK